MYGDPWLTGLAKIRGRHLSYQRGRRTTHPGTSLIKIEGVDNTAAAKYVPPRPLAYGGMVANTSRSFYLGKKIAYVYKASTEKRGTKIRVIWGKVTRPHGTTLFLSLRVIGMEQELTLCGPGNSGVVRAKFTNPLPARSFGASVRVMLYPSSI